MKLRIILKYYIIYPKGYSLGRGESNVTGLVSKIISTSTPLTTMISSGLCTCPNQSSEAPTYVVFSATFLGKSILSVKLSWKDKVQMKPVATFVTNCE